MKKTQECDNCGLIWWGEVINVVEGETEGLLENFCPNCGSEDIDQWDRRDLR